MVSNDGVTSCLTKTLKKTLLPPLGYKRMLRNYLFPRNLRAQMGRNSRNYGQNGFDDLRDTGMRQVYLTKRNQSK